MSEKEYKDMCSSLIRTQMQAVNDESFLTGMMAAVILLKPYLVKA